MSNIEVFGELLTASAEDRTLTYKLLPFEEPGATNVGAVTVTKGSLTIPDDISSLELNEEHDYKRPIGRFVSINETDTHIEATVRIAATKAGDDALILASEGLRKGISVEIDSPVIRGGRLKAGVLTGAGLVVRPAFKSAQLVAADCGDLPIEKETPMETETPLEAAESVAITPAPVYASNERVELGKLTFEAMNSGVSVQAALADQLTTDDLGKVYIGDQEIGELFEARKTERPLVEKVGIKPLTSLFITGTRKQRTFAVADWAGNKAVMPTGKFTTSRENWQASAKAVAVDVALEHLWFGDESVISDLYSQAVESYIAQTESELVTKISAEATAVTAAFTPLAAVNQAAQQLGSIGARFSFVVASPDVYSAIYNIKASDAPWWLAGNGSMNVEGRSANVGGITIAEGVDLPAKTLLVGDSRAIDYRESAEFRLRAANVAQGGVDIALVKFNSAKILDPGAILKFTNVA